MRQIDKVDNLLVRRVEARVRLVVVAHLPYLVRTKERLRRRDGPDRLAALRCSHSTGRCCQAIRIRHARVCGRLLERASGGCREATCGCAYLKPHHVGRVVTCFQSQHLAHRLLLESGGDQLYALLGPMGCHRPLARGQAGGRRGRCQESVQSTLGDAPVECSGS